MNVHNNDISIISSSSSSIIIIIISSSSSIVRIRQGLDVHAGARNAKGEEQMDQASHILIYIYIYIYMYMCVYLSLSIYIYIYICIYAHYYHTISYNTIGSYANII